MQRSGRDAKARSWRLSVVADLWHEFVRRSSDGLEGCFFELGERLFWGRGGASSEGTRGAVEEKPPPALPELAVVARQLAAIQSSG
ncbi:hypothetical protein MTO96_013239 [Rhipicephalus appendiculatus]